ncbi:MAG: translation initiation factor IF-2 [Oscillospiraceae bacterium]|nr:translation initiation factor IF-2 [Oscillospiraceae bacterium]
MSTAIKYRIHDVAKDFGLKSKDVSDIMTRYFAAPKNHMQALTEEELNLIFAVLTENHQIESIESIFADIYREPDPPPPPPQPEPAKAAKAAAPEKPAPGETQPQPRSQPQPQPQMQQKPKQPKQPQPPRGPKTTHIIDTRGANVDLSRFDDRVERLVPEKAGRMKQGKEKFKRGADRRPSGFVSQKRLQEEAERRRQRIEYFKKQQLKVSIPDEIAVGELAMRLKKTGAEVVKQLMKLGVMASLSQNVDFETASLVAMEFGAKVEREVIVTIEERLIDESVDADENLIPRDPVVVVMGHVDHGKTSLLDYIRKAEVAAGEHGGITQHIGAYRVHIHDRHITFLDTPGHAAFTSMRARGASVTDIAVMVVAADDGIMAQTVEAINHAKAAGVPIVVALNKIDKDTAEPERIKQQLTEHGLVPEEWGGDTIVCPVSAKSGEGVEHLLEMLILQADVRELKANPARAARGAVIEAKLDKGRGPVATVLVQNGTLKQGDIVIAGKTVGRIRAMTDDKGQKIEEAGPSVPVEVIGLSEVPEAGDIFHTVADERMARELVSQRKYQQKDEGAQPPAAKVSLDDLFAQIQQGQIKDLNLIVKADVHGSSEALKASLEKISNEEVRVRVIHTGVGVINASDVLLASTASAIIIGFNVRADASASQTAEQSKVDIRYYRVIYDCIEEIEAAIKGMVSKKFHEVKIGEAEVRQVFKATNIGTIAGSYVRDGKLERSARVRVIRDGIVVHEGAIASLKRFKDDAKEVASGYECGISLEKYTDVKEGDVIEAFVMEELP